MKKIAVSIWSRSDSECERLDEAWDIGTQAAKSTVRKLFNDAVKVFRKNPSASNFLILERRMAMYQGSFDTST